MVEFIDANTDLPVWLNPDHVVRVSPVGLGSVKAAELCVAHQGLVYVKGAAAEVVAKLRGWQEQVMQGFYGEEAVVQL